jgi:hypothetical protein
VPRFDIPGLPIPIIPSLGGGGDRTYTTTRQPGETTGDLARRLGRELIAQQGGGAPPQSPPAENVPPTITPEPTSQPTPDVPMPAPPLDPTWGEPVPRDVQRTLGESQPGWFGAGIGNWIFGVGRKKLTKAQRAARRLDNLIASSMRKSSRVIIDEAGTLITTPRVWGTGARIAAGVGIVIGGAIDVLWPSQLGNSDLTPLERQREHEKGIEVFSEELTKYTRPADPRYPEYAGNRRIGVDPRTFPLGRETNIPTGSVLTPFPTFPEVDPDVQSRGRRGIEKYMRDRAERALKRVVPEPLRGYIPDMGPPRPSSPAAPSSPSSSSSSPRPTTTTTPTAPRSPARIPTGLPLYLGIALVGAVVPGLFRRGSGSQTRGGITNTLTPSIEAPDVPSVSPIDTPMQYPAPSIYSAGGGFSADGYCTPRPRGPRRKCLQRAPVKFTGGPRKGKAAGTKCIKFASRKS